MNLNLVCVLGLNNTPDEKQNVRGIVVNITDPPLHGRD